MSRFYDCDDGDYPAHWAQIDFERRVASRNGQAALRALAEALLALPERKLAHRMIVRGDGVPCTIGCYARDVAGLDLSKYVDREDDDHELTEWLGRKAGLAKALNDSADALNTEVNKINSIGDLENLGTDLQGMTALDKYCPDALSE